MTDYVEDEDELWTPKVGDSVMVRSKVISVHSDFGGGPPVFTVMVPSFVTMNNTPVMMTLSFVEPPFDNDDDSYLDVSGGGVPYPRPRSKEDGDQ